MTPDRKLLAAVERLARALRAARQQVATGHGLSLLGVTVLETLDGGRAMRVGDLAAELDVSQPTASDALAVLERRRLVARRRDPDDLRATLVSLTTAGADTLDVIVAELAPTMAAGTETSVDRGIALRVVLGEIARLQHAGVITVNRSCLTCHHYEAPDDGEPARCLLLDVALGDGDLRVDCPEHQPAS